MYAKSSWAASWSGIIDPSRAIDWSNVGVVGGIPSANWTQCGSTISAGASAATIQTAIDNCAANHYVMLGPGTFNLTAGIVMKSDVVLRGMGANQTFLNFSGADGCAGAWSTICFAGSDSANWEGLDAAYSANWTAGYAKGANQITLTNVGSDGIKVGQYIYLDQENDTATNNGLFVCENTSANPPCSVEGGAGDPGRVINNIGRQQSQIVKVTAINGNVYTISPGLYGPNWSAGKNPGAWWSPGTIQNAGVENMSIDATNSGGLSNVSFYRAANIWISGTRLIRTCSCERSLVALGYATHATIQNNYFYGTTGHSVNYGIDSFPGSDNLIVNNIFQHVVAPMMVHGTQGSVYAYNYAINDTYDDDRLPQYHWLAGAIALHSGGDMYDLFEGNIGPAFGGDYIHGNQVMNTIFRNYWLGSDPGRIDNLFAFQAASWNRYWNAIGNVLGTPGLTNSYANSSPSAYNLGYGYDTLPDDPLVASTMMRWGNYDTANATVRWLNSEVPSGLAQYANPVPASHSLPASFYYATKPSWWGTIPWPAIGPDVTGGNIANLAGHAYNNPAKDCYINKMGGPADGSGNPLAFNASSCYSASSDTTPPVAPQGLSVQ